jgi:hypothetical protein
MHLEKSGGSSSHKHHFQNFKRVSVRRAIGYSFSGQASNVIGAAAGSPLRLACDSFPPPFPAVLAHVGEIQPREARTPATAQARCADTIRANELQGCEPPYAILRTPASPFLDDLQLAAQFRNSPVKPAIPFPALLPKRTANALCALKEAHSECVVRIKRRLPLGSESDTLSPESVLPVGPDTELTPSAGERTA